ncbi:MAG: tRNA (adenosine(37)-N6)-dimethylallyltransferase MiaA [Erysipelotrichaceae bacterium]|nr:tRNA (adenosine(37)-N6)-dimethylallyltransferase MiaA [Erysipelotrichaceae bacterium]
MKKVLVVAGPTASGKTAFSVQAAQAFNGIIISGDSVQVYRGFDIGSGKVTEEEKQGIPHYLIDVLDPKTPYSAADFQREARAVIDRETRLPIIAGGTGLYLKACLYDYVFHEEDGPAADSQLEVYTNEELYTMLREADPVQAQKIHPNNRRRLLRSLTILRRTGQRQSDQVALQSHEPVYDALIVGCTMERAVLYERINARVHTMVQEGLRDEVASLLEQGITFDDPPMKGIGYKEWKPYFEGECSIQETEDLIARHSRQYAKKQYTWFNHQMPVYWFNAASEEEKKRIMEVIRTWLEQ